MLCETCQKLFKGSLGTGAQYYPNNGSTNYYRDHHQSIRQLHDAVLQGCFICDILFQDISQKWTRSTGPFIKGKCFMSRGRSSTMIFLTIEYKLPKWTPEEIQAMREMAVFTQEDIRAAQEDSKLSIRCSSNVFKIWPTREFRHGLISGPHDDRTDSVASFALASMWLKNCTTYHPECNTDTNTTKMPARRLKLAHPTPNHVQLCDTEIDMIKSRYMTLSHCWGEAKFLILTTESSQQLFNGVLISKLPRTFQDAVKIVKTLGADYLWIDSLCIFQDSTEDWQKESQVMGDVYKGALCNIAASVSGNSNGGCIQDRDPRLIEPCIVTTEYPDQTNDQYHITIDTSVSSELFENQLLLTRGWVVQERLLPSRVLYFAERQLFWECRREEACETYPYGISHDMAKSKNCLKRPWLPQSTVSVSEQQSPNHIREVYVFWWNVVKVYSKCELTKEEDKLVAISGLAKEVNRALGGQDQYLAGLWRRDMLSGLLWHNGEFFGACISSKHYRAPSWSWASLDGQIHRAGGSKNLKSCATLVDARLDHVTEDTFGQVKNGYIRLRGSLMTVEWERKEVDAIPSITDEAPGGQRQPKSPLKDSDDELNLPKWDLLDYSYDAFINGKQFIDEYAGPIMDVVDDMPPQSLHFMPLCEGLDRVSQKHAARYGLLLRPTGKKRGQFTRCGLLGTYPRDAGERDKMLQEGLLDWSSVRDQDWLEYEEYDGREYTISVI